MLIIDGTTIKASRGDDITILFSCEDKNGEIYTFTEGETIQFRIFDKDGYKKEPLLYKEYLIDEDKTIVEINLTSAETTIGEPINNPKTYWYEISINEINTIIGYENDPALFVLLPARGNS